MRTHCEQCQQPLTADGLAFICSHECTYCPTCADALHLVCNNCQGELTRRPRRRVAHSDAAGQTSTPA